MTGNPNFCGRYSWNMRKLDTREKLVFYSNFTQVIKFLTQVWLLSCRWGDETWWDPRSAPRRRSSVVLCSTVHAQHCRCQRSLAVAAVCQRQQQCPDLSPE